MWVPSGGRCIFSPSVELVKMHFHGIPSSNVHYVTGNYPSYDSLLLSGSSGLFIGSGFPTDLASGAGNFDPIGYGRCDSDDQYAVGQSNLCNRNGNAVRPADSNFTGYSRSVSNQDKIANFHAN